MSERPRPVCARPASSTHSQISQPDEVVLAKIVDLILMTPAVRRFARKYGGILPGCRVFDDQIDDEDDMEITID